MSAYSNNCIAYYSENERELFEITIKMLNEPPFNAGIRYNDEGYSEVMDCYVIWTNCTPEQVEHIDKIVNEMTEFINE